jgi:hypothetical protein
MERRSKIPQSSSQKRCGGPQVVASEVWINMPAAEFLAALNDGVECSRDGITLQMRAAFHPQLLDCVEMTLVEQVVQKDMRYSEQVYEGDVVRHCAQVCGDSHSNVLVTVKNVKTKYNVSAHTVLCPIGVFFGTQNLLFRLAIVSGFTKPDGEISDDNHDDYLSTSAPGCSGNESASAEITLRLNDAVSAKVHKEVLVKASPVFKSMLAVPMLESRTNSIQLNLDCSCRVMRIFLACLYRPTVEWHNADAVDFVARRHFTMDGDIATPPASVRFNETFPLSNTNRLLARPLTTTADLSTNNETLDAAFEMQTADTHRAQPFVYGRSFSDDETFSVPQQRQRPAPVECIVKIDVDFIETVALPLLRVAHQYQVSKLAHRVETYCLMTLSPDTVTTYYTHALRYQLSRLTTACCAFVGNQLRMHALAVNKSRHHDDATDLHERLLHDIVPQLVDGDKFADTRPETLDEMD